MPSDSDLVVELVTKASECEPSALTTWEYDFVEHVSEKAALSAAEREKVEEILEKLRHA